MALIAAPQSARADLTCTFEQMQISPVSVIEPCSKALAEGKLGDLDKAQAFYVRGRAYARTARTEQAGQDFDVAVKLAPSRSDIWVSRALAEGRLGRWNDQWNDLLRALTLNPKEARAWFAMGQIYRNSGDNDHAIESLNRALAIDPAEPYSLLFRSSIFASRHQLPEVLADATALVNIPPTVINKIGYIDNRGVQANFHVVALNHRASLYESVGDEASARRDLESAIAEEPAAGTFQHLAASLFTHKQPEEALKSADEALRLDPGNGDLQFLRGQILVALKRDAEALESFEKAIASHERVVTHREQVGMDYLMRARMLRSLGKTNDAVASAAQAVTKSPEVRSMTVAAMTQRGYLRNDEISAQGATFDAALRACMIDSYCN